MRLKTIWVYDRLAETADAAFYTEGITGYVVKPIVIRGRCGAAEVEK